MEKLLATLGLFLIGFWVWNEFFREIPHLEQKGVLKNFHVVSVQPHQASYTVLEKRFISPVHVTRHSDVLRTSEFKDLSYVSNIDVLLAKSHVIQDIELTQDEVKRCFFSEKPLSVDQQIQLREHAEHLSLIASSKEVTNTIRRLKTGQRIQLVGDYVDVFYAKEMPHQFHVGMQSSFAEQCRIFRVKHIQHLDD